LIMRWILGERRASHMSDPGRGLDIAGLVALFAWPRPAPAWAVDHFAAVFTDRTWGLETADRSVARDTTPRSATPPLEQLTPIPPRRPPRTPPKAHFPRHFRGQKIDISPPRNRIRGEISPGEAGVFRLCSMEQPSIVRMPWLHG